MRRADRTSSKRNETSHFKTKNNRPKTGQQENAGKSQKYANGKREQVLLKMSIAAKMSVALPGDTSRVTRGGLRHGGGILRVLKAPAATDERVANRRRRTES